jgi:hypothetical protein
MLSVPYQSKTIAKKAATKYAQTHGLTKFNLLIDAEKKLFHFADIDQAPEPKKFIFAIFKLVKGKWRDKTPLAQVTKGG